MKGWKMYSDIQQLKEDGLTKAQVERKLNINYKTVMKYWDMTPQEYHKSTESCRSRKKKLAKYEDFLILLLKTHSDYTVSQLQDRLWEQYPHDKENIKYSTLRRFVKEIRKKHNIPKEKTRRQYQAVADPPPGYQAQVDLGVIVLSDSEDNMIKLFGIAIVLSKSRYKYVEWFDRPPTTGDFINFHDRAFQYLKGMPKEIVYDQDRLLIVSENFGDIIYTAEFEIYRQKRKFKTFICRSSDPESKGKIEAVVKYAKRNFAKHRIFTNIQEFNRKCIDWLERTGNGKIHGTTKKVPAEAFREEVNHLSPVPEKEYETHSDDSISRKVRKDNTILYATNRYSVPLGTYEPNREVDLEVTENVIKIIDPETGEVIANHKISMKRGQLIQNRNHLRDHSQKIKKLYQTTLKKLGDCQVNQKFLQGIWDEKPRYVRDQFSLIIKLSKNFSQSEIDKAIAYCLEHEFYSATMYKSVLENTAKLADRDERAAISTSSIEMPYTSQTEVRELSEYEKYMR